MAVYSAAVRTPAAAAGAAYADVRTTAAERARIMEIGAFGTAATAASIGLVRPASSGTASTTTAGQPNDPGDAPATAAVGSAWSAAPTISGTPIYLRRFTGPALAGAGVIWTFPLGSEIVVPVSGSFLLWNFGAAAGPALDLYIVWNE